MGSAPQPIPLPITSLAGAIVGMQGTLALGTLGISASSRFQATPGTLRIFNESGCGLAIGYTDRVGPGFQLIAGDRRDIPIYPGESGVTWSVTYVISNAPVTLLLAEYYPPGQDVPPINSLGNSPIGGNIVALSATALNLISSDNAESVYLDDTSFAGVNTLIPSQYPTPTGARDVGIAARTGAASAILALLTIGASNEIQAKSHLGLAVGTLFAGGWQVYTGTGPQTGFAHGLGVTPQIALLCPTSSASTFEVGNYSSTTVDISIGAGAQWKMLIIV